MSTAPTSTNGNSAHIPNPDDEKMEALKKMLTEAEEKASAMLKKIQSLKRYHTKQMETFIPDLYVVAKSLDKMTNIQQIHANSNPSIAKLYNDADKHTTTVGEFLYNYLEQRSRLFSLYSGRSQGPIPKDIFDGMMFSRNYFNAVFTPSIRIDVLLYVEDLRDDKDLFKELFGVSPRIAKKIRKFENAQIICLLDAYAYIRVSRYDIPNSTEKKFRDFCDFLSDEIRKTGQLPDMTPGAPAKVLYQSFWAALDPIR